MKKKLIIFDMDGVIIDSTQTVAQYFMEWHPTLTNETLQEMLCGNFHEELEKIKKTHATVDETEEVKEARKQAYMKKKASCPTYEGIVELLKSLHEAGHILTINTSAFEKNCLPILESSEIKDYFDFIATADISKSKIEKFKILQEKYQFPKGDIIFITDTLGDVREADLAGIPTIAVTYGAHDRSYFEREHHDNLVGIVESVEELAKIITKE